MKPSRFLPNALPIFAFAVLAVAYCFREGVVFSDGDSAWHIVAGDLIRQLGHLPEHDPWSFTAGDAPWFNIAWLFDVGVSLLHQAGGLPLLFAITILLHALLAGLLTSEALRRQAGFFATLLAAGLGGGIMATFVQLRGAMITHTLTVAFYLLLSRDVRFTAFLLPLLMVVWVNCHGAFIVGFSIIGFFWLEALLRKDAQRIRQLFFSGLACGAAVLVNPYGIHIVTGMMRTLDSVAKASIGEWGALDVMSNPPVAAWIALLMISWRAFDERLRLADKLLVLFWLGMALHSIRFTSVLMLLSIPYLAQALAMMADASPWRQRYWKKDASFAHDMATRGFRMAALVTGMLAVMFVALPWPRDALLPDAVAAPAPPSLYPKDAVAFINAHYPQKRFLTHYNFGGGIIYLGRGQPKIFVDGRAGTAYPEKVLKDFLDFVAHCGLDARAQAIVKEYKLDGVMLAAPDDDPKTTKDDEEAACWRANPLYHEVYSDKVAIIYIARKSQ